MVLEALFVLGSYLLGSLPVVHLLARRRGVNLRQAGTGNVGAGNLWQQVGVREGVAGSAADILKGGLPPLTAALFGLEPWVAASSGVAAAAGQMWPLFLGFNGGRGNGTGLAALAVVAPSAFAVGFLPLLAGALLRWRSGLKGQTSPEAQPWRLQGSMSRSLPLGALLCFLVVPPAAGVLSYPAPVVAATGAIALLIVMRRATAELSQDRQLGGGRLAILRSRILYDRQRP